MIMILISLASAAIVIYTVIITINLVKKNKIIKDMQKNMEVLRYSALDSALINKHSELKTVIKLILPNNRLMSVNMDKRIVCGRLHNNDICIDDESVSKKHCCFYYDSGVVWVEDLHSSNLTVIERGTDRIVLSAGDKAELHSGDTLLLGNIFIKVQIFYCVEA